MLNIMQPSLPTLPEDLQNYLFTFFNIKDLSTMSLVRSVFRHEILSRPALWRSLILRHFNYLQAQYPEQYSKDPRALFIDEYTKRSQKECAEYAVPSDQHPRHVHQLTPSQWLAILAGQLDVIEQSAELAPCKAELYILAASAGHRLAIEKCDPAGKDKALQIAATHGNADATVKLLQEEVSDLGKGGAIFLASKHGNSHIVALLLKEDISPLHKGWALVEAARLGYTLIVKLLRTQSDIYDHDHEHAFAIARQNQHPATIEAFSLTLEQLSLEQPSYTPLHAAQRNAGIHKTDCKRMPSATLKPKY